MEIFGNNLTPKNADFLCEKCNFKCIKKSEWLRHVNTIKHCYRHDGNDLEINGNAGVAKNATYNCVCGKIFLSNSGLWKHNKKCNYKNTNNEKNENELNDKELVLMLIKENSELKNMMMKVIENGTHNTTTNNNTTNSHNKTFNLQFFLNETCKDAMNIMDFVNSIKLQLSDLEKVGKLGYVEGISDIIVKNLKELDVTERPIHCTDSKRETLYVKDENKWEKEDDDKFKLKKAIKRVANKNIHLLPEFKSKYPDCIYSESKKSDQYNKIILEAFELENPEKQEKIIKKIAKEVIIDK